MTAQPLFTEWPEWTHPRWSTQEHEQHDHLFRLLDEVHAELALLPLTVNIPVLLQETWHGRWSSWRQALPAATQEGLFQSFDLHNLVIRFHHRPLFDQLMAREQARPESWTLADDFILAMTHPFRSWLHSEPIHPTHQITATTSAMPLFETLMRQGIRPKTTQHDKEGISMFRRFTDAWLAAQRETQLGTAWPGISEHSTPPPPMRF